MTRISPSSSVSRHETGAGRYEPVRARPKPLGPNVRGAAGLCVRHRRDRQSRADLVARGYTVRRNYAIDVLIERHGPDTAPLMCARALAQSLAALPEKDHRRERLHAEVPVIANATSEDQVVDQWINVLHRLCSSNDPIVVPVVNQIRAYR
jgi:hypothetical protein